MSIAATLRHLQHGLSLSPAKGRRNARLQKDGHSLRVTLLVPPASAVDWEVAVLVRLVRDASRQKQLSDCSPSLKARSLQARRQKRELRTRSEFC